MAVFKVLTQQLHAEVKENIYFNRDRLYPNRVRTECIPFSKSEQCWDLTSLGMGEILHDYYAS
jgi:hypothetical protein